MCGIVAHIGGRDCAPILLEGLARLEYRGYDSAWIAPGPVRRRPRAQDQGPGGRPGCGAARAVQGQPGHRPHPLGHPRRAERRRPAPARLRVSSRIVHNGIIENADELRAKLSAGRGRVRRRRPTARCLPT